MKIYFQDDSSSVKRFKPSPVSLSGDDTSNGSSNSLKIRLSRYPASSPARPERSAAVSGRLTRGGSKESSSDEGVAGAGGVKQEKIDGVSVKMCEVRMSPLGSLKLESDGSSDSDIKPSLPPNIHVGMTSSEIIRECERVGPGKGPISSSVMEDQTREPKPKRRHELPKLTPDQLLPATPSVHVRSKQEAFSPQLLEWCLQRPITVIRGMAQACDIDLGLYTTKTLAQTNPNHPVEIRTQLEQNSDENWDPSLSEEVTSISIKRCVGPSITTPFKDLSIRGPSGPEILGEYIWWTKCCLICEISLIVLMRLAKLSNSILF